LSRFTVYGLRLAVNLTCSTSRSGCGA
jgi:hypothetical protein